MYRTEINNTWAEMSKLPEFTRLQYKSNWLHSVSIGITTDKDQTKYPETLILII